MVDHELCLVRAFVNKNLDLNWAVSSRNSIHECVTSPTDCREEGEREEKDRKQARKKEERKERRKETKNGRNEGTRRKKKQIEKEE